MTIQEINIAYNRIVGSLDSKELKNAFDYLQSLIAGTQEYAFQDAVDKLRDTYKYMLRYRIEGVKDPMQESIYNNLLASTYELTDEVRHKALAVVSPLTYYSHKRMAPKESFEAMHQALRHATDEAVLVRLFEKVWTSGLLKPEETAAIQAILEDSELHYTVGCQVVSALLLGSRIAFDKEKLSLLFDAAGSDNPEIRCRALIGILLTLYTYRRRMEEYPRIANRLAALAETTPDLTKSIRTIILRFILARETEKIAGKLQEEIIQEIIKSGPKFGKEITPDLLGGEMNPEWQEKLANSSLGKKMIEFSELQLEGADVMHSTFTHLKHFPFFRELSNWFMPFTASHSVFGNATENPAEQKMLSSMAEAPFMCNSDKYSLFLGMRMLPEQARQLMTGQLGGQASEMIRQTQEELPGQRDKMDIIAMQYIQDLYRFFKLHPRHLDFEDIFTLTLDFHNLPIIRPYIDDKESLTTIAEFYLRKRYFPEALTLFSQLSEADQENDTLYQKIGYCKQMSGDIQGALNAYLRADLLQPDSKWVIRRIAGCYRTLKQPEKALGYYRRCEAMNPDDLSIQLSIGHCQLELKEYNEALKYYFKVDYLDPANMKAWRPIAWCSFLVGKYDQARGYYKKIIDNQPNTQDFLNAGHTEWALQHVKEALALYRKAVEKESGDFQKFRELFDQDIPDLLVAGIEEAEIPLMLDQLRYTMDGTF